MMASMPCAARSGSVKLNAMVGRVRFGEIEGSRVKGFEVERGSKEILFVGGTI
jgi:hypothetical protein